MYKTVFKCPNCSKALKQGLKQYFCPNGHNFDIARKGYVNLLLSSHIGAGTPGDGKDMLLSRRNFLDRGFYEEFSNGINALIKLPENEPENPSVPAGNSGNNLDCGINILDAGCGEGYYISRLKKALACRCENSGINYYGTDVSRDAINYAASRDRHIRFAVASSYHLPFTDSALDYILCIFAPRDEEEFWRILKPSGKLLVAVPGARHLYGLKQLIYEAPEAIGQKGTVGGGFKLLEEINIRYEIELTDSQDIFNLFNMTPYSRHAGLEAVEKLDRLETEVDFSILLYERP